MRDCPQGSPSRPAGVSRGELALYGWRCPQASCTGSHRCVFRPTRRDRVAIQSLVKDEPYLEARVTDRQPDAIVPCHLPCTVEMRMALWELDIEDTPVEIDIQI